MIGADRLGIQSCMSRTEKNNQKIIVRPVNGDKSLLMGQSAHCGPQEHGDRGQTRIIDVVQDRAADDETPKREKKSLQGQLSHDFHHFAAGKHDGTQSNSHNELEFHPFVFFSTRH